MIWPWRHIWISKFNLTEIHTIHEFVNQKQELIFDCLSGVSSPNGLNRHTRGCGAELMTSGMMK